MARQKLERQPNLLEYTPCTRIDWEGEPRQIALLVPKFKNAFLQRHISTHLSKPHVRVKLDEYGSCVWQHIDGCRTVQEIALTLREQYGEAVEPVFDRVGLFICQLYRNQFIQLEKK